MDGDFGWAARWGSPTPWAPERSTSGDGAGKQGYLYLLDRDDLGGFRQGPGGSDKVVQRLGPIGGVWSRTAAWPGEGGWAYLPTASPGNSATGSTGQFNVFTVRADGTGLPALALAGQADGEFGFGSSPSIVTSDGMTPGTGLVWIVWSRDGTGAGAELRAYDTRPVDGTLPLRLHFPMVVRPSSTLPASETRVSTSATGTGTSSGSGTPPRWVSPARQWTSERSRSGAWPALRSSSPRLRA